MSARTPIIRAWSGEPTPPTRGTSMSNEKRMKLNANTLATTPRHIWMSQVFALALVTRKDANKYCTRERINRWASDFMPVWMAADSLRAFVEGGKRAELEHQETNYLASKMKVNYE